jgi:hypothetical protein
MRFTTVCRRSDRFTGAGFSSPAGLYARQVEDVVDQLQQVLPTPVNGVWPRLPRARRVHGQQLRVAEDGIQRRNSWLMLARNSLFARLAASAACRAARSVSTIPALEFGRRGSVLQGVS